MKLLKHILILLYISFTFKGLKSLEFYLFTTLYNEKRNFRIQEYQHCLNKNCQNSLIKKVIIFLEGKTQLNLSHPKIKIVAINQRPSYYSFMYYANKYYPNKNIIISNGDIFFDNSLKKLADFNWVNKFLALTRYDYLPGSTWKRHPLSFDSWLFKAPLSVYPTHHIKLGIPSHDIRYVYQMKKQNITVMNPSLSIKTWHVDSTKKNKKPYKQNTQTMQKLLKNSEFIESCNKLKILFSSI